MKFINLARDDSRFLTASLGNKSIIRPSISESKQISIRKVMSAISTGLASIHLSTESRSQ